MDHIVMPRIKNKAQSFPEKQDMKSVINQMCFHLCPSGISPSHSLRWLWLRRWCWWTSRTSVVTFWLTTAGWWATTRYATLPSQVNIRDESSKGREKHTVIKTGSGNRCITQTIHWIHVFIRYKNVNFCQNTTYANGHYIYCYIYQLLACSCHILVYISLCLYLYVCNKFIEYLHRYIYI